MNSNARHARSRRQPHSCLAAAVLAAALAIPALDASAEVRELATDRPDVTESPISVPRGWMQVEMDALIHSRHEEGGLEIRRLGIAAMNLKIGVSDRSDLQLVYEPYVRYEFEIDTPAGTIESEGHDSGELALRLKWNLAGNDGGPWSLGLLPWISHDTSRRDADPIGAIGLAVPMGAALSERIGLGAMAEWSLDTERNDHALLGTATLALDLVGSLGVFGEVVAGQVLERGAAAIATFNAGATFGLGPDFQLDGGARIGLTDASDDLTLFLGFAARKPLR
jgi:hypothetical protein